MEVHYKTYWRSGGEQDCIDGLRWFLESPLKNAHLEKKVKMTASLVALLTERLLEKEPALIGKVADILECDGGDFTIKEASPNVDD